MTNLLTRLEEAAEGSRELDAAIRFNIVGDMTRCNFEEGCYHGDCNAPGCGEWLGIHDERRSYPKNWRDDERLPHYTTSLDAALTLVSEKTPGFLIQLFYGGMGQWMIRAGVGMHGTEIVYETDADATTPALALCIAVLRMRRIYAGQRYGPG